jgi:hypothetical protein
MSRIAPICLMLPGAAVATAQQVLLTRARTLDGLSKNDEMGVHFRAVHYLPIVSGTNFRRNLEFSLIVLLLQKGPSQFRARNTLTI